MKPLARPPSQQLATSSRVAIVEREELEASTARERDIAKAWEDWYPAAMDYAEAMLDDADLAEDVVGEVGLRFVKKWDDLSLEERRLPLFIRAVHDGCVDRLRRLERQVELTEDIEEKLAFSDVAPIPAKDLATGEIDLSELVKKAVARLPKKCRSVFQMRRIHEMSRAETARILGLPEQVVSNYLSRADALMRAVLPRYGIAVTDGIIRQRLAPTSQRRIGKGIA